MSEPTTQSRADLVHSILSSYAQGQGLDIAPDADGLGTVLADFMADVMHWCDANDLDLAACEERARGHYLNEQTNYYTCAACGHDWQDEWSCACDDTCPHCGARNISPHTSTPL